MRTLKCEALDCAYNNEERCSADTILVSIASDETFCDTYTKNDSFVDSAAFADTEFGEEPFKSPRIKCNVTQCVYNKSFRCHANKVQIDDPHDEMICNCLTYHSK